MIFPEQMILFVHQEGELQPDVTDTFFATVQTDENTN